ncbi:hypothetical protein H0H87_005425 [Tephrocybe sp. NHM501043]|nr:hypothetical protein H0H87_005425 [Tephrocybe sp. NHM501043]
MASTPAPPPLAERTDIHKSCKSLETLLNIFNDYCEAAGAIGVLQKKLAKALRDTAGMKATGAIAANALNASATIFEMSSDIDAKFAKISDKEYDAISGEVKKWFKKLAKEEKFHDERMANANARIKQAGQVYEKKSKKNSRDATEEHAPITLSTAAACLSRVADAEWLKTCEGIRRYSPTIGQLGEWRALCEGGWYGPIPPDLVDPNDQRPQPSQNNAAEKKLEGEELRSPASLGNIQPEDAPEPTDHGRSWNTALPRLDHEPSHDQRASDHSPTPSPNNKISPVTFHRSSTTFQDYNDTSKRTLAPPIPDTKETNMDSVRSLSAFPLPPTHFPIPPRRQQTSQSQSSQSSTSYPSIPRLTESPLPREDIDTGNNSGAPSASDNTSTTPSSPVLQRKEKLLPGEVATLSGPNDNDARQSIPETSGEAPASVEQNTQHMIDSTSQAMDTFNDREFGVNVGDIPRSRAINVGNSPPALDRTDRVVTGGSIVAAMRTRYSDDSANTSNPISPKVVHRLSGNINELANRYQVVETPSLPRYGTPSASRQLPLPPSGSPRKDENHPQNNIASGAASPPTSSSPRLEDATRRRQQRLKDLAQLELKEKELALREHERDLQQKALELGRERAHLNNLRETDEYGPSSNLSHSATPPQVYSQLKPRERKTSFRLQRQQSQTDAAGPSQLQQSYNTTHLAPPSPSSNSYKQSHSPTSHTSHHSHSSTLSTQFSPSRSPTAGTAAHAPYCGCESCSATKYRMPQAPPDPSSLRPPAEPITLRPAEKKPGWMRRLSMPVGNAFSLDSKKAQGVPVSQNFSVGAGVGSGQVGRRGFFSMDGKKNASSTQLNIREDGRRSYESSGVSNRSMTHLGLGVGRR